ncbi:hypothetical protein FGO68_gene16309 [Halteria grandinella]|uniref:Uncharacterized protein n=1 Tax=Halteria grandinella TaxID=5974 RepID=A0A8J8NDC2_HALGN|nr:hypothetical protein FGO68_gene16309 [Halteria grandinella]
MFISLQNNSPSQYLQYQGVLLLQVQKISPSQLLMTLSSTNIGKGMDSKFLKTVQFSIVSDYILGYEMGSFQWSLPQKMQSLKMSSLVKLCAYFIQSKSNFF